MKRIALILLLIPFLFSCTNSHISVSEYDSVKVKTNESSALEGYEDEDLVLKAYKHNYYHFALGVSAGKILKLGRVTREYCTMDSEGNYYRKYYRFDFPTSLKIEYGEEEWTEVYKYALKPERVFGRGVKVHNVFFFRSALNGGGFTEQNSSRRYNSVSIVYVTSKGDYVLYYDNEHENKYLLPYEVFCDIAARFIESEEYNGDGKLAESYFDRKYIFGEKQDA